jgi:hypothetical protein
MNTQTSMLVKARISSDNGPTAFTSSEPMDEIEQSEGLLDSPTGSALVVDELDVGGSEFSWSSAGSVPSPSAAEDDVPTPEVNSGDAMTLAQETTALDMPPVSDLSEPSAQTHSLYFWESITFKVSCHPGRESR